MAVQAIIRYDQATQPPGTNGQAFAGVLGELVTAINVDNTDVTAWTWTLLDAPILSSLVPGVISSTSTATFTPDARGSYQLHLLVEDGIGGTDEYILVFAVGTENHGWLIAPFQSNPSEINFSGQTRGWAGTSAVKMMDSALQKLDAATPDGTDVDQIKKWNGTKWIAGALNLAAAAAVTGVLAVANGGTGLSALGAANTVAKVNAAGTLLEYGKLTTANLDAAAAIVGTQLAAGADIAATQLAAGAAGTVLIGGASNSFSAAPTVTSLAASSYLAAGGTVATAGALRLAHGGSVQGRDNANAADRVVASWGVVATDVVNVGDANVVTRITGSALHAYVGATQVAQLGVAAGDFVAVGANPAATGGIRLGNAVAIYARNAANSANIQLCVINASNNVVFGDTANNGIFFDSGSGTSINLRPGGANGIALSGSACNIYISGALLMQFGPAAAIWDQGVASPASYQARRTGDNAAYDWQIRAQSASATGTGANVHGGHLLLRGGAEKGAAAGKKGGVRLQLNATTETMLEATEVAVGRRVVALCRGSDVTTTQMPSGTGDRVVYIENCATARSTGTPVGGGMLEVVGGDVFWINEAGVRNQLN